MPRKKHKPEELVAKLSHVDVLLSQGRSVGETDRMTADIIRLASRYGCYGYRRITAILQTEGWIVNAQTRRAHLAPGAAEGSL